MSLRRLHFFFALRSRLLIDFVHLSNSCSLLEINQLFASSFCRNLIFAWLTLVFVVKVICWFEIKVIMAWKMLPLGISGRTNKDSIVWTFLRRLRLVVAAITLSVVAPWTQIILFIFHRSVSHPTLLPSWPEAAVLIWISSSHQHPLFFSPNLFLQLSSIRFMRGFSFNVRSQF